MSLSLSDLFAPNAVNTGGVLNIDLASLATATGFNGDVGSATASQIAAMLILYWVKKTETLTDDPTKLITASQSFQSITLRGGVSQIANSYSVNIHTANTSVTLDPDNVV